MQKLNLKLAIRKNSGIFSNSDARGTGVEFFNIVVESFI